jgi:UDP-N-acetylmuramate dehydrogenase
LERQEGLLVRVNEPLSKHTSFGVGGPADLFVEAWEPFAVAVALRTLRSANVPYVLLGKGTNVLVTDAGVRGAVVSLYPGLSHVEVKGTRVIATAGVTLGKLCHVAADMGLSGAEFLAGIPGTVGGALNMNAGANGGCAGDLVAGITVLDAQGAVRTLVCEELEWGYRNSTVAHDGFCVLEATFSLTQSSPDKVHQRVYQALRERCRRQPLGARSAGSIFKRPPGDYAGRLLEEAGAKGLRVGGAEISRKHANFIVNTGSATAADILNLIRLAQKTVYERFGVWLELEVCVVGELPEDMKEEGFPAPPFDAQPRTPKS